MKDFEIIYAANGDLASHIKCRHCGEMVERGIITVSEHWMNCLKRTEGLVIAKNDFEKKLLDAWSINSQNK